MTDKAGKPLEKNPFKDARVRRALSKAINRQALVERVMDGLAIPAGQFVPEGFFGYAPGLKPEEYDPDGARKLLAEAGYPDGFGLTLHGPNNRYVNDEQVVQAVAQMLAKIGIATRVETLPFSVYTARARKFEFSAALLGWGVSTGEGSYPARFAGRDRQRREGAGRVELVALLQPEDGRRRSSRRSPPWTTRSARSCSRKRSKSRSATRRWCRCTTRSTRGPRAAATPTRRAPTSGRTLSTFEEAVKRDW